jgi:glycogen(starch) synthase
MRSLFLVGPLGPPSGGVTSHLWDLRSAVVSLGGTARMFDPARRGCSRKESESSVARAVFDAATRTVAGGRLAAALGAARARGDLVHLHTNGHNHGSWEVIGLVGLVAGAASPTIGNGRGSAAGPMLTLHSGLAPGYLAAHPHISRLLAERYHRVVCVSQAIAEALLRTGFAEERLIVVPAFSPTTLPLPLPPPGLGMARRRHRPLLAATLSRGAEYGADVLVEGFTRLVRDDPEGRMGDAGLVLFGPAARDPQLAATLQARGLGWRVYAYADLDRGEALAVLRTCDVFLRPTRADGDSISVREALALGVRVVASDAAVRPAGVHCHAAGSGAALAAAVLEALAAPAPAGMRSASGGSDTLAPLLAAYRAAGLELEEMQQRLPSEGILPVAGPAVVSKAAEAPEAARAVASEGPVVPATCVSSSAGSPGTPGSPPMWQGGVDLATALAAGEA